MKIRSGFVSNSSSSSFIIATKNDLTQEQLVQVVEKVMKVPKESPLYYMIKEVSTQLGQAESHTLKELIDDCYYDLDNEIIKKANMKGMTHFYTGSASDDTGETATDILCDLDIHYEDDEIIIEKDGGY